MGSFETDSDKLAFEFGLTNVHLYVGNKSLS
jgi:hypothetical protein